MIKTQCPVCKMKMNQRFLKKYYECSNCKSQLKLKISFYIKLYFSIFIPGVIGGTFALHMIPNYDNKLSEFIPMIFAGLFVIIGYFSFFNLSTFKLKRRIFK